MLNPKYPNCRPFTKTSLALFSTINLLLLSLLLLCTPPETKQAPSTEKVKRGPWEINNQLKALGKCMNLGNALEAPNEGEWGVTLQDRYFTHVKELGFQSVRIPVRWSNHVTDTAPWAISDTFFTRVIWAIDRAMKNDLRAIVNVHHFEQLMSDPKNYIPVFLSIWKQVAERCSSYGPELYFELCNEPADQLTPLVWDSVAQEALTVIRATNPTRSVIIGPTRWNNDNAITQLTLPADSFLIATVHYYKPADFTHQGAMWVPSSDLWKGIRWRATHGDTMAIINNFDLVDRWAQKNSVPVFLGEFGVLDTADTISRVLYTAFIAKQALSRGWSYAYWKYNNNFGIYDDSTNVTRDYLVSALLKPDSTFAAWQKKAAADKITPSTESETFLLLDDFDDQFPGQTCLITPYKKHHGEGEEVPYMCQWSTWYQRPSVVESVQGVRILPVQETGEGKRPANFHLLIGDGFSRSGLHAVVRLRGNSYPVFNFSTSFTGTYNKDWFDFSALTAVSFQAKGRGMMRVNLITDTILNGYTPSDNWGHFGWDFGLTPEWQEHILPVATILPKPWSKAQQDQLKWSDGMKKVCSMEFASSQHYDQIADDSLEVFIDDIKLWGMTEKAFFK